MPSKGDSVGGSRSQKVISSSNYCAPLLIFAQPFQLVCPDFLVELFIVYDPFSRCIRCPDASVYCISQELRELYRQCLIYPEGTDRCLVCATMQHVIGLGDGSGKRAMSFEKQYFTVNCTGTKPRSVSATDTTRFRGIVFIKTKKFRIFAAIPEIQTVPTREGCASIKSVVFT